MGLQTHIERYLEKRGLHYGAHWQLDFGHITDTAIVFDDRVSTKKIKNTYEYLKKTGDFNPSLEGRVILLRTMPQYRRM